MPTSPPTTNTNVLSPSSYTTASTTGTNYEEKAVFIFNALIFKCGSFIKPISKIDEISCESITKVYKCIYEGVLPDEYGFGGF